MRDHCCTRRKWLLAIVAGALGTFGAEQMGYAQGTWTDLAPVPAPTEGMTAGGVGKVIITAYGASSTGDTNLTRLYDITTDSWSLGSPAPLPARSQAAYGDATHAGFLYVIGGGNSGGVLSDLQRYDPVTDTWTTGRVPMPTPRASLVAGHSGQRVYAIGGWDGSSSSNANEVYNIAGNSWSMTTPMSTARLEAGTHSHGGRVYVVGGANPAFGSSTVANEVFKP